ncbi:hypothetical protein ACU4GD_23625 [Cupriavidus basilensis]
MRTANAGVCDRACALKLHASSLNGIPGDGFMPVFRRFATDFPRH